MITIFINFSDGHYTKIVSPKIIDVSPLLNSESIVSIKMMKDVPQSSNNT